MDYGWLRPPGPLGAKSLFPPRYMVLRARDLLVAYRQESGGAPDRRDYLLQELSGCTPPRAPQRGARGQKGGAREGREQVEERSSERRVKRSEGARESKGMREEGVTGRVKRSEGARESTALP